MLDAAWLVALADIAAGLPDGPDAVRAHYGIRHGTMRAGLYAPRGRDDQTPHTQDELYIVAAGRGTFVKNGERRAFEPGDLIFVEAGAVHRFEDFSADFMTWVIFWGPPGGEGAPAEILDTPSRFPYARATSKGSPGCPRRLFAVDCLCVVEVVPWRVVAN